ncbi:type I polyketide synthase, partial [Trinickia mobilis]|uniref:type I polyketide synthase n=1 Tax=Trinickia mobilis TaxID=2816356 RepID=UPI001A8F02E8
MADISLHETGNLVAHFNWRADCHPDKILYTFLKEDGEEIHVTFAELREAARRIAASLRSNGVQENCPVLLLFHPGIEYIHAFFGCLFAGAIPVPAYPPVHARQFNRLNAVIEDAQADFALTGPDEFEQIRARSTVNCRLSIPNYLVLDEQMYGEHGLETPNADGASVAFLQYTSGSTGKPKGVMVTHRNLCANLGSIVEAAELTADDVMVFWLPPYHDFGLIGGILAPMFVGARSVLMRPSSFLLNPFRWLQTISNYGVTVTGAPNFAFDLCVRSVSDEQRATLDLSRLRVVFNGAEPIRINTLKTFNDTFGPCGFTSDAWLNAYGLAESTLMVAGRRTPSPSLPKHTGFSRAALQDNRATLSRGETDRVELVSVGHVVTGHNVIVVDPATRGLCAVEQVGEIWVKGPSVAKGYWRRIKETQEAFHAQTFDGGHQGYLRTGDLGFYHGGELYICGRHKDVVIIRGMNIYPQDVEFAAFEAHSALRKNGTVAFSLELDGQERLVVVQELDFRKRAEDSLFGCIASSVLNAVGVPPDTIVLVKAGGLPRTSSGKVQRRQCKADYIDGSLKIVGKWDRPTPGAGGPLAPVATPDEQTGAGASVAVSDVEQWLRVNLSQRTGQSPADIDPSQTFAFYGLDSMAAVQLAEALSGWLRSPISPTVFWEHPTVRELATFLAVAASENQPIRANSGAPDAQQSVGRDEAIAIVGLSCNVPGAANADAFWALLHDGVDAIRKVPDARYAAGSFASARDSASHTSWGGFLDSVDRFDAHFFGISPVEAERMDPQQRLVLEAAWEALEDAAIPATRIAGTATGVFIGVSTRDYDAVLARASGLPSVYSATGSAASVVANRISYVLNLNGPSVSIDTACSSSLVAVHSACQSLRNGESDLALAGGVNVILSTDASDAFASAGMLAPDGRCKSFDSRANGYVRGEGCSVVVLKRLRDAVRDGDPVRAVILGSSSMHDGRSNGLMAPSGSAQTAVIRSAIKNAGISKEDLSYIEAHGTGTALGDPIELNALKSVFSEAGVGRASCAVGSAKSNIGHLEAAAGIVGLAKVVLALESRVIPPTLHYQAPNPHCSLEGSPLRITSSIEPWNVDSGRRIAGVSSFGFGGSIAHVIVSEAPDQPAVQDDLWPWQLLTFSAKTHKALDAMSDSIAAQMHSDASLSLADIAYTHQTGRAAFGMRRMLVCRDAGQAAQMLGTRDSRRVLSAQVRNELPKVVFMFPGQGTQRLRMGEDLYRTFPRFRAIVDWCSGILKRLTGLDLLALLYSDANPLVEREAAIRRTDAAQPAIFVIEYAWARLWMDWGIVPSAMIGHSIGEYVAACIAGVFSLEDALALVAERSRLMQALPEGVMLSVALGEQPLREYLRDGVSVAAINSADRCVVSGDEASIEALEQRLVSQQIVCKRLVTSHAFHSHEMEPILADFAARVGKVTLNAPSIPYLSNVTGNWIQSEEVTDPAYWARHLREPVRFGDGLTTMVSQGSHTLLEVGSGQALTSIASLCIKDAGVETAQVISCSTRQGEEASELESMLEATGRLWLAGHPVDWAAVYAGQRRKRVRLATYPFQRERYWIEARAAARLSERVTTATEPAKETRVDQMKMNETFASKTSAADRKEEVEKILCGTLAKMLRTDISQVDSHAPLLELGADSLVLVQAIKSIEQTFGVTITIRQVFEELTTIAAIAEYVAAQTHADVTSVAPAESDVATRVPEAAHGSNVLPPAENAEPAGALLRREGFTSGRLPDSVSVMERIMSQQLEAFERITAGQIAALGHALKPVSVSRETETVAVAVTVQPAAQVSTQQARVESETAAVNATAPERRPFVAYQPASATSKNDPYHALSGVQRAYLEKFVDSYNARLRHSRALAVRYRPVLADNRASAGFRYSVKEMLYPIISERSEGAYIWDADGNQYIDLTMGFGVNLFGHRPAEIQHALDSQIRVGFELGPQTRLAGEVAKLVSTVTGNERVAFCNSGTEAVMLALRLARTVTQRKKIAIFAGSFHGWSDDSLVEADGRPGSQASSAMAPGIHPGAAEQTIVLEYGAAKSLETIRAHAHELAAVLVEPIQSRRPDWQPREFLHDLRALTHDTGIALIFDEMITGFRLHPGGAQAWYGVKADLATYGKVVGGGMPVGLVAGSAKFLDAVDGGQWQYGDMSYPKETTTFFAGTFCKHPLMLVAAREVLRKLIAEGPELQERLNERTSKLVDVLNDILADTNLPIRVVHCGSLFRLEATVNIDLLFYHLVAGGLYIWEGRNMFLSTAHSDADISRIVEIFEKSVQALIDGGFFPGPPSGTRSRRTGNTVESSSAAGAGGRTIAASSATHASAFTTVRQPAAAHRSAAVAADDAAADQIKFSLSFFGHYDAEYHEDKYSLLFSAARYADEHGFSALWLPERHFHAFGGLSPNPVVLCAALARETREIQLRAGSVVLPLHHSVRVAEEWSMVDNLSNGRVGIACASGWHPNDFVFAPEAFGSHREKMFEQIEQVRSLWSGQSLPYLDGSRHTRNVTLFPMPKQAELPVWVTVVNNPDTYRRAGLIGAGILTNLMGQSVEQLASNLRVYRQALAESGYSKARCGAGVTVLLHTFIGEDAAKARAGARDAFIRYLKTSIGLFENMVASLGLQVDVASLSDEDRDYLLSTAYERYVETSALIGSPQSCAPLVERLRRMGVDEIGCFIDFGVNERFVVENLDYLNLLRESFDAGASARDKTVSPVPHIKSAVTSTQQGILIECQVDENATRSYNSTTVVRLEGLLDDRLLRGAIQTLVDRHSALRTTFDELDLVQYVSPVQRVELPIIDLSELDAPRRAVDDWLAANNELRMDLRRGPLFLSHLLKTGETEHFLVVTFHHLVIDGYSQELFLQELAAVYTGACRGTPPVLEPAMPFGTYVEWHESYLRSDRFRGDRVYWTNKLHAPLSTGIEWAEPRRFVSVERNRAKQQRLIIPSSLHARLQKLGSTRGSTTFMVMLAVVAILIRRLTNQEDLVIGVPMTAGRAEIGDMPLMGCTLNLVPIRFCFEGNPSFVDFLAGVRADLVESLSHSDYPFGQILKDLDLHLELDRRPLASVLFNLNRALSLPEFGNLQWELYGNPIGFSPNDLVFDVIQLPDQMEVQFQYRESMFDDESIDRMMSQLLRLLDGVVSDPSTGILDFSLLGAQERMQLLDGWNETAEEVAEQTLVELFEAQVQKAPEAVAAVYEGASLSYGELNGRANRLARELRARGVGAETLVGICVERSLEMMVGLLGILKAGGAYVPLDPGYPAERLAYMLEDAQPVCVVSAGATARVLPAGTALLRLDEAMTQALLHTR